MYAVELNMTQKHISKYSFIPLECVFCFWMNIYVLGHIVPGAHVLCVYGKQTYQITLPRNTHAPRYMPLAFFFLHLHSFFFSHKFITMFIIICINTNTYSVSHVHILKYSLSCFSFPPFPRSIIPTIGNFIHIA